ncbi:hypothetical protein CPB85DRAFT_1436168 [Mucidula mucida]|nr:hypothetical protein CPB85DRAFT_1436168 [Mucidula mucida]
MSPCTNCGAFPRRSLHHEEEYQSSVLLERLRTSNFPATDQEISHIRHTILPTISDDISSIDSKVASLHEVTGSRESMRLIGLCTSLETLYTNYWYWEDDEAESPHPPTNCPTVEWQERGGI